jgi:ferredoxin
MRIVADRDVCVGAGQCVLSEPKVFDQSDEDGIVVLRTEHPDTEFEENVRTAVNICPSGALSIAED